MQHSFYTAPYANALATFPELHELIQEEGRMLAIVRRGIDEDTARNKFPMEYHLPRGHAFKLARLIADADVAQDVASKAQARSAMDAWMKYIVAEEENDDRAHLFDTQLCEAFKAKAQAIVKAW